MSDLKNDGRFPDESPVLTPYPLTPEQNTPDKRDSWSWLPGTVLEQVAPDEWLVVMDGRADLAYPDPDDPGEYLYPICFRDPSELRAVSVTEWERLRVRKEGAA